MKKKKRLKKVRRNDRRVKSQKGVTIRYLYLFNFILLVMGFVYGAVIFNTHGQLLQKEEINSFILNNKLPNNQTILPLFMLFLKEFSFFLILWFLSLTIVGIIVVVFVIFFIGFLYGFTMWYFMSIYGAKGIYLTLVYTFPKNILMLPFMLYFTTHSIIYVLRIFYSIYLSHNTTHLKLFIQKYFNLLFFIIGILIIYVLMDAIFINSIGNILKKLL